jgi:guanylate kinase
MPPSNAILLVISAPSGGGKTTVCDRLLATHEGMTRAVTCTTRPPRAGEKEGVDYYFLDEASFERKAGDGEFLEHAIVYGNRYGNLKSEVLGKLRSGKDVLLTVDVQGAAAIQASAQTDAELKKSLVTVFLTPPSLQVLEQRLRRRGSDSEEVLRRRLSMAQREIAQYKDFDYLVISTSIEEDLRLTLAIVEAEKMRSTRALTPLL